MEADVPVSLTGDSRLVFLSASCSAVIHAILDDESSASRGNPPLNLAGVWSMKMFV